MIHTFAARVFGVTALLALPAFGTALDVKASGTKTFYLNSRAGYNQISVASESTVEDFTSLVNRVTGECKLDPKNLEGLTDRFTFKLKDVKTGIALRDEQMLGADWFDAGKYPDVVLKVNKVEGVEKVSGNSAKMTLVGTLSLHGVTRDVRVPITLTYLDQSPETMLKVKGDVVRARGAFEIKLSDFKVTGPAGTNIIGVRVADVLKIRLSVFGASEPPPPELTADVASSQPAGAASQPAPGAGAAPRLPPPKRPGT